MKTISKVIRPMKGQAPTTQGHALVVTDGQACVGWLHKDCDTGSSHATVLSLPLLAEQRGIRLLCGRPGFNPASDAESEIDLYNVRVI